MVSKVRATYMLLGPAASSAAAAAAAALSMASRRGALTSICRSLFRLLSKFTIRSRWPACCCSNLCYRPHTDTQTHTVTVTQTNHRTPTPPP